MDQKDLQAVREFAQERWGTSNVSEYEARHIVKMFSFQTYKLGKAVERLKNALAEALGIKRK